MAIYALRSLTMASQEEISSDSKGSFSSFLGDYEPFLTLFGENKYIPIMASGRIQRWILYLSEFDYHVVHSKGRDNKVVDRLSKLPDKDNVQSQTNEIDYVDFMKYVMPVDYELISEN
ncbi:Hypothetical protein CINCED_3A012649 [Cinara cedri]|uniref:Reverse transcriptase RNase H-like domain-containing protein n=1 Tax=Cinara cedri TaxID=506608 RepID=A0A5E4MPI2_9HEMI|nr:Hypothetical protein CINCED_3A012649 [Cinara cedri]